MGSSLFEVEPQGRPVRRASVPGIELIDSYHEPGLRLSRHCHARTTITFLLTGTFEQRTGSRTLECGPADVVVKPPGAPHTNWFGRDGVRSLIVQLEEGWLRGRLLGALVGDVACLRDGLAQVVAFRLVDEFALGDEMTEGMVEASLSELLLAALARRPRVRCAGSRGHVERAREFLHASFRRRVGLADAAAAVDLHPVYLARIFRRHLGVSVGGYLRRLRLDAAITRLSEADVSITRAAIDAGFADHAHFTRTFRRLAGRSPSEFQRRVAMVRGVQARPGRAG